MKSIKDDSFAKTVVKIRALIRKSIRDPHGNVVIWQTPNVPLIGWLVCSVAVHIINTSPLKAGLGYLGTAFLFTWSYLELMEGASYFRRLLGLVVLLEVVISFLMK